MHWFKLHTHTNKKLQKVLHISCKICAKRSSINWINSSPRDDLSTFSVRPAGDSQKGLVGWVWVRGGFCLSASVRAAAARCHPQVLGACSAQPAPHTNQCIYQHMRHDAHVHQAPEVFLLLQQDKSGKRLFISIFSEGGGAAS